MYIIREMQIKTTLRYYLFPMVYKKYNQKPNFTEGMAKETLNLCWQACTMVQSLWKTVTISQTIKKPERERESLVWFPATDLFPANLFKE